MIIIRISRIVKHKFRIFRKVFILRRNYGYLS
nr:MAG TPA: hypothetical protein [Caudoviricetes sp.]